MGHRLEGNRIVPRRQMLRQKQTGARYLTLGRVAAGYDFFARTSCDDVA